LANPERGKKETGAKLIVVEDVKEIKLGFEHCTFNGCKNAISTKIEEDADV
jgi:hypothetical protein